MMTVSDEALSAYLDGQLDAEARREIETRLVSEPDLRRRLAALEEADDVLRAAFDPADLGETPDRMKMLVSDVSPAASNVVQFRPPTRAAIWRGSLAAGLALVLVGGGYMAGRQSDSGVVVASGPMSVQPALAALLDRVPSGASSPLGDEGEFRSIASYRLADGRICREFDVAGDAGMTGLACRGASGWRLEVAAATASPQAGYAPVAGPSAAIDGVMDQLGANALTSAEEADLIGRAWRP